jgi:hypothetical protein
MGLSLSFMGLSLTEVSLSLNKVFFIYHSTVAI